MSYSLQNKLNDQSFQSLLNEFDLQIIDSSTNDTLLGNKNVFLHIDAKYIVIIELSTEYSARNMVEYLKKLAIGRN